MVAGYILQTTGLYLRGLEVKGCPIGNQFEIFQFTGWSATTLYLVIGATFRLDSLRSAALRISALAAEDTAELTRFGIPAEVAATLRCEFIVNVQGDEPSIEPELIDAAVDALRATPEAPMSTIASPFGPHEDANDPNIVKVVLSTRGTALYFSRAPIPCWRDRDRDRARSSEASPPAGPLKHVGLYVYRRAFLETFVGLPPTPLECTEQLEQLRVLEHGYPIAVARGMAAFHGIDTPEQYEAWVRRVMNTR